MKQYDAVVVGSGPNGLSAAITLAQAHLSVLVLEGKSTVGGGMRSAELTLPGFVHDICSAVHPLGAGSPFFKTLPLNQYGLQWIFPPTPLAHPFKDGHSVFLERSIEEMASFLGSDFAAYKKMMQPLVANWSDLSDDILAPLHFPKHPLEMLHFAFYGLRSCVGLANKMFHQVNARALFAGLSAHSIMPLDKYCTAAFGLILGILGHVIGWPIPKGGSQNIANALAAYLKSLGGEIVTNSMVENWEQIPSCNAIFFDVTPKQFLKIAGSKLSGQYRSRMEKYRYGPGVFKMDWALDHPIPWKDPACAKAGTIHLGGTLEEIARSERQVWQGQVPGNNFILLAQPSLFDPSRAPHGKHVAWAYCHVPHGCSVDMIQQIEQQIEQYAPGFIDCILARHSFSPQALENYNPNYIGGDINGGIQDIYQLFSRPIARLNPYSTPLKDVYLCSSSTPPGGGVHGMCGYLAARSALKNSF